MAKKKTVPRREGTPQLEVEEPPRLSLLQGVPAEEERGIDDLIEFPLQQLYFDRLSDHDLLALADDIRRNGLRNRVQILAANRAGFEPNTVLDGHMRRLAMNLLGRDTVPVLVRYDLATADAFVIEQAFLEGNDNRRHMDKLARARVALRRFEIEKKKPRGRLFAFEETEARGRVGRAIGMSGRNLNRYFRVLKTPIEIQRAFQAGKLGLVEAGRVAGLEPQIQARIADRIRAGEDAKMAVAEACQRADAKAQEDELGAGRAFIDFSDVVWRRAARLGAHAQRVDPSLIRPRLDRLNQVRGVIDLLIRRAEEGQ